ncbi:hypothetical protein RhiJN_10938 [Ceratobasidium sp. AG-Ba]|nr:hypothetical protein RhiJN_10938 [Ceratobasidium sp. AG-Ba]QRW11671.1 hypothetical protein RhiLY_10670 [Ceratobasidium sp. AG-Ba]
MLVLQMGFWTVLALTLAHLHSSAIPGMSNQRPQRLEEAEVAAMSIALRHRAAEIKRTAPDQYEELLKSGQTALIPEPWGEPGRDSSKIDRRSEKPRGYNIQVAVGLKSSPALHNHYLSTVGRIADAHLIYATRFSDQPRSMVMKVVLKVLGEEPIFHCYYDQWPIVSYIISHLNSQINQNRNAQKKIASEESAFGQASLPGEAPANANLQAQQNSQPSAPTNSASSPQQDGPSPPFNAQGNDSDENDRMTPPAPPLPARKRRGNPDKNAPGARNTKAKKLKAQEDTSANQSQVAESPSVPSQRRSDRNRVESVRNATPGPGPTSIANQKKMARQNARNKG